MSAPWADDYVIKLMRRVDELEKKVAKIEKRNESRDKIYADLREKHKRDIENGRRIHDSNSHS